MTVGSLLNRAKVYFLRHGVPEASANAQFLMASALEVGRLDLELKRHLQVSSRTRQRFWRWVVRRSQRIPLAHILGTQPFSGMELKVAPGVLIPRPETEELTEIAIHLARRLQDEGKPRPVVLDIGTGSGCITLAMARALPEADFLATDISRKAVEIAKVNAWSLGLSSRVKFLCAGRPKNNWAVDLVVSNPPYIPSGRLNKLEPEVLREPRLALDGGPDGLKVIRRVIAQAADCLRPGGWLALEIDSGQGERVKRLLIAHGFCDVNIKRDLRGLERFAIARLNQKISLS